MKMITLSNGDKWIIDDSEVEGRDEPQSFEEAGNLPETTAREFIDQLVDRKVYTSPQKLVRGHEGCENYGYWDYNSNPYVEILSDVAVKTIKNDFSAVHEMPWGEVLVAYRDVDSGGYDSCIKVARFANREEYMKSVTL
jgi:hypothetical protein